MVADQFGSSETGQLGGQPGAEAPHGPPRLQVDEVTCVLDEQLRPIEAGSAMVGRLARGGRVPLRYHGHPEASAATFVEVGGQRWALPGDLATVDITGAIEILGRASLCINTGGEKVFPDEVEAAIKGCPGVRDVVVVGVPDPRWGQRVTAVLSADRPTPPTVEELRAALQGQLAGYKLPKAIVVVDDVHRSPTGKADYRWALAAATSTVADEPSEGRAAAAGGSVP
jgi:acyl-CoA synthetase (AMP-forming)/AMP-acid ligase II